MMKINFTRESWLSFLGATLLIMFPPNVSISRAAEKDQLIYIGTYTDSKSKGIYLSHFNADNGHLSAPQLVAETKSPSFLAIHPNHHYLYAAGETDNFRGKAEGMVSAFRIDSKTGALTLLNQQASGGSGPCHLELDRKGGCVLVANYGSGSIAALPARPDGRLGEPASVIQHQGSSVNKDRQAGPHAHFITTDHANRLALVCDLGLDKVLLYDLDPGKAELKVHNPPFAAVKPGAGPRHLVLHPSGKWAYVINEMGSSITTFDHDSKRGFVETQNISTLPEHFSGTSWCAEIQVHPSGRFIYGSNRGHDSIAIFTVNARTGGLTSVGYQSTQGKTPRHFAIDPGGKWLLAENQGSDNIVVFHLDEKTGQLTPTGQSIEVGSPVCIQFLTARR